MSPAPYRLVSVNLKEEGTSFYLVLFTAPDGCPTAMFVTPDESNGRGSISDAPAGVTAEQLQKLADVMASAGFTLRTNMNELAAPQSPTIH